MGSPPRAKHSESRSPKEIAERAARIAAMLDRWEAEDVSGEPDWNVEDLEPLRVDAMAWTAVPLSDS